MASGYGVNGSGIMGHSGVTGHDALVAVEMVRRRRRRRGAPREARQAGEEVGKGGQEPWLWFHFHSGLKYPGSLGLILQSRAFHKLPKSDIQGSPGRA